MNFQDMLKKKKKTNMENSGKDEDNILDELQAVNEANQNHKDEEIETLEVSDAEKLRAEIADAKDKYVRLYAEFDNFKRRTSKERIDLLQSAGKDIIVEMLPILDDFERAAKAMESATEVAAVKEGVSLIYNKLKNTLQQKGLKEMQSTGTVFDPDVHEAITNIPAPSNELKGKVVDELEKGYYLNDKVIRFAKVVVGA
jgi:molecular chaperone GrpE